jgi:hypothetical protein
MEFTMLFLGHYRILPGNYAAVIARFQQTGGQPPEGVKLLGRWHSVASGTGVSITEADDASAMARFALQWNDLMELEVGPALTDEQLGAALATLGAK